MARLKELNFVVRNYGAWKFLKRFWSEINEDNVFTNAAAMAYAWMFAVFPFMIFVMTLLPYVPERFQHKTDELMRSVLAENLTPPAADSLMNNIRQVFDQPRGGLLSVGLLLTLFAASGGMNATMTSLDQAFDVDKPRRYLWKRIVAMMLTIFMCVCLIIIILAIPIGSILTEMVNRYNDKLPDWAREVLSGPTLVIFTIARYVIGLTVMQILIGVIYHFGRSRRERLIRFFTPGSIFAAIGWIATGMAMRYYVEHFANYSKTYGAVAGMVIMLMVFYVNAIIILAGAELDSEIEHTYGELKSHFRDDDDTISRPCA